MLAAEHRLAALGEPALLGERDQERDGLVGDPVLRVVEVEAGRLGGQPGAAVRVVGEQFAQVTPGELAVVGLEPPPALAFAERAHPPLRAATRSSKNAVMSSRRLPLVSGTSALQKKNVTTQTAA